MTFKADSINEIQASDTDPSTAVEDNDSIGWKSHPEIARTSEESDTHDMDKTELLDDSFYEQDHKISNLEYPN